MGLWDMKKDKRSLFGPQSSDSLVGVYRLGKGVIKILRVKGYKLNKKRFCFACNNNIVPTFTKFLGVFSLKFSNSSDLLHDEATGDDTNVSESLSSSHTYM